MDHHSPDPSMNGTVYRNPATQEILGSSSLTAIDTFKQIVKNAQKAQKSWAKLMDRISDVLGISSTMDEFVSRKDR